MHLTLVILAAGVGTRYGGLKQLMPIGPCGETLLEYSAYDALRAGFERIVLVVRPDTELAFRDLLDGGLARHISATYVNQSLDDLPVGFDRPQDRIKPWGTGHAVLAAEPLIDGAFAVVNADDFYGAKSFELLAEFLGQTHSGGTPTFSMVGFEVGQTLSEAGPVSRGLCQVDDRGYLQRIVEIPQIWKRGGKGLYTGEDGEEGEVGSDEPVSMNIWGFTPDLFPELKSLFGEFLSQSGPDADSEFYLPDAIQTLLSYGHIQVKVLRGTGRWAGMTYREDEVRVAALITDLVSQGRYPVNLWA